MEEKLNRLKEILGEIADLNGATALLGWDMQTYMPPGGTEERGYQLGTLSSIAHQKSTSQELGKLLEELKPLVEQLGSDSDEYGLVRLVHRNYQKDTRIPTEFVAEMAKVTATAQEAWVQARQESKFAIFQPHLEKVVELTRRYAEMFAPYEHVYDPLLDNYEPGLKTAEVQAIFDAVRPEQVALVKAISERPVSDDSFLHQPFDEQKQWAFGVDVITRIGYDWKRGRQDKSAHPFTTSFGINDSRITTRFDPTYAASSLMSTIHEAGHALYEQGFNPNYMRTPLASGTSMAVHESQSRLWENIVGRSFAFWTYFYPSYQKTFPEYLGNISLEAFYKGINRVSPSLIRTESDEATYNLHIMLRMELEIALLEGKLKVSELPEVWATKMKEYLGVVPDNDTHGVLQDIHWSHANIGYFPTYALGNLVSAQLWEKIGQAIPDINDQIARGEFGALLRWLRENIHQYGAKYEPQELIQRVTGSKIDPQPYLRYLRTKYGEIYGL